MVQRVNSGGLKYFHLSAYSGLQVIPHSGVGHLEPAFTSSRLRLTNVERILLRSAGIIEHHATLSCAARYYGVKPWEGAET